MDSFLAIISGITGWILGLPMLILLSFGGIFLSIRLGFFQIRYAPYILKQTFGKMLSNPEAGEGTVSPFQAVTAALASTVGASNIIGVPAAICFGGLVLYSGCGLWRSLEWLQSFPKLFWDTNTERKIPRGSM